MGVLEVSASMGLIVAAPTAGASGVLPGVLIALQQQYDLPDEKMLDALLVASAVGVVVAENSGISGAAGGCPCAMQPWPEPWAAARQRWERPAPWRLLRPST